MRILYIVQNLNRIASNTVALNIINNLKNILEEVFLVSLYKSGDDNYYKFIHKNEIPFIEFNDLQDALCNISKIVPFIERYDIIHTHQYKSNEYANLLQKFNTNIKLISTCHSEEDIEDNMREYTGNALIASRVRLREQSNFFRKHNKVIAVSNAVKQYLLRQGCLEERIEVIFNGIDYSQFPKFNKIIDKNTIHFCQIGHILKLKNQLFSIKLIEYLLHHGLNVKLHLFGGDKWDKEYNTTILNYINTNHLRDKIVFYHELPFNLLFEQLQQMTILIMPSFTEGLPLSLLEAFYFQIPAIVSNNGGMKEIIQENMNGLVIDLNTKDAYKKIYNYCVTKQYILDGKQSRELALKNFSAQIMSQKYFQEYVTLANINHNA